MSKAAKTCSACSGRGRQLLMSGGDVVCSICNGTGIETTGVADNRDAWGRKYGEPQPATANATGHDGCIRGLEKANATIAEQAAEIERLRGELNERGEALTMAEMSLMETDEEVKGLRADRDNWKKLFTDHLAVESQLRAKLAEATLIDAPELRTERDTLRLENQRLKATVFEDWPGSGE